MTETNVFELTQPALLSPELKAALARVASAEEHTLSKMAEIVLRRWLKERGELK